MQPTLLERVLPQTNQSARHLFELALMNIRNGRFAEARDTLQELLHTFPEEKTNALGSWSMGLAYYEEGGRENFRKAADIFGEFVSGKDYDPDLEELYQAALIDVAFIELELAKSTPLAPPSGEKATPNLEFAILALEVFLEKWPDSPHAGAAQSILQELLALGIH
jgi:outer membrane protein assembly factor BamD (BamD/ComL family)